MNVRRRHCLTAAGAIALVSSPAHAQVSAGASVSVSVQAPPVVSAPPPASAAIRAQAVASAEVRGPSREDVGAALARVPLRLAGFVGVGWTRSWDRPLLDGYATEIGGSLGVWALPWLAIEGRGSYVGLLRRVVDADADGRADADPGYLSGVLAAGQLRVRLIEDHDKVRNGWSFALGAGAFIPWANHDGRAVGAVLEAAVARHVGALSSSGATLDVSLELRGRTGLASLGDYQSLVAGLAAAWEGGQRVGAPLGQPRGYRPGHTAGFEGSVGGFFSNPALAGTNVLLSGAGAGFALHAGLVLSPGFELVARGGYLGRAPGRREYDWLNFGFAEAGARARWYLFFAEADAGLAAPFGTLRDRIATTPFVGGALGLRVPFTAPESSGFRFVTGLRARVGLSDERTFDSLQFTAGFEFEGGPHHAAFPRFAPREETLVVAPGVAPVEPRASVGTTARVGAEAPSSRATLTRVRGEDTRIQVREPLGYRPGFTVALDAPLAVFPMGAARSDGRTILGLFGTHVGLTGGVVFTPGFEWSLRAGYLFRQRGNAGGDLSALTVETGPRMRIGWLSARAIAGYAGVVGALREDVRSAFYAGAALQARLAIAERVMLLVGLDGRFALSSERALDHIGLSLGFEFEGGSLAAAPFGRRAAPSVEIAQPAPAPVTTPPPSLRAARVETPTLAVDAGVTVPLRFALATGMTAGARGLGRFELDGSGGWYALSVGWVPTRWLSLEATGSLLSLRGRNADSTGSGALDVQRDGMLQASLTVGPRFRVLTDDFARFGWSFLVAGGVLGGPVGVGPVGELAVGHHLAAITSSRMAFEFGVEARGRLGWIPNSDAPSNGALYHGVSVGVTAAWEGNVRAMSAPMTDAQLGNTLSVEGGFGLALSRGAGPRSSLGISVATVGVRTGVVFTPGFEWSARAAYLGRSGERGTESHEVLLAETGPRARWGWAYGELALGYAGTINAYRDSVAGALTAAAGAGVRFGLTGPGRHFGVTAGVQARFGLSPERAYDGLFAMVGLEFEGGRRQAAPFPEARPAPSPRGPTTVTSTVTAPAPAVEVPVTSPRYQATGGAVVSPTITVPSRVEVGLGVQGGVSLGGATTLSATVLIPGAVVDSTPFGTGSVIAVDEIVAMLPAVDSSVRALDVELRTHGTASALLVESALREAIARRYGAALQTTVRVAQGASLSGRFELTLRAR